MSGRKTAVGFIVLVALIAMVAPAQAEVAKGDKQIILNFNYQDSTTKPDTGPDTTFEFWNVNGSFGRFFTNHLQGSLSATVSLSESSGQSSDPSGWAGLRGDWHFNPQKTTVFYAGLQAFSFFQGGQNGQTEIGYGGQVGLKAYIKENIFFNGEINRLMTDFDTFEDETTALRVGFGFQF